MAATFVGRQAELAALRDLCAGLGRRGRPVVGVVLGEPGSGKTRLLAEVGTALGGIPQVRLAGYEPEAAVGLASARDLLGRLSPAAGAGSLLDEVLASPVDDGGPGPATSPDAGEPPAAPLQLYERAYRALRSHGPLLLIVDDLQWVDGESAGLLHYLVRAAESGRQPFAVLAAARTSYRSGSVLRSLRGVVAEPARTVSVELGPLDRGAALRLVREVAPDLDGPAAEEIRRRGEGSPFWLETLAAGAAGSTDVATLLSRRLRDLDADTVFLLSALALAGRPLAVEDLAALRDWTADRTERALEQATHAGLAGASAGGLRFTHDLIRTAVVAEVPSGTAAAIHRRLADTFERQGTGAAGGDPQLLLAALEHRRASGGPVLDLALRLAAAPGRRLLGRAGLDVLDGIARYSHPVGRDGPDPDLLRLRQAVAEPGGGVGPAPARASSVVGAGRRGPGRAGGMGGARGVRVGTSPRPNRRWAAVARPRPGRRWYRPCRRGRRRGAGGGTRALARAPARGGQRRRPPLGAAARALDTQPGRAATLPPQARRAYLRALLAATEVGLLSGRPDDVVAFSGEAAGWRRPATSAPASGRSPTARWDCAGRDAMPTPRTSCAGPGRLRRLVLPQPTLEVGAVFAKVLYSRGRLAEAVAVLAECRELGDRLGEYCPARAISVVVTHLVDHSLGPWQRAARGLLDAAAAEADPHYRLHAWLERASMLARLDPRRSAADVQGERRPCPADAADGGCGRCRLEVSARAVDAVARLGDLTLAGSMLDEWTDTARSADPADVAMQWWGQQARATLAAARGELAEAEAARRRLAEEAERQGQRIEALWVRLDLGAQVGAVDREGAAAVLRTAGQDAELMGAMTEQQVADRALRALGVRTWRRGTVVRGEHVAPELTDREREVARLAASGASNPEIAAALFLSRKTVERHLSNSLAKLGLRNRVELAAVLGRETGDSPRPEGAHR